MFNWFVTIFMIVSIVILFAAWTRAIRVKEMVDQSAVQREWSLLRVLVFVALICEVVLLIIALVGLQLTFAYLSGIYLIYFSLLFFYLVSFFLRAVEVSKSGSSTPAMQGGGTPPPPPASPPSPEAHQ